MGEQHALPSQGTNPVRDSPDRLPIAHESRAGLQQTWQIYDTDAVPNAAADRFSGETICSIRLGSRSGAASLLTGR